MPQITTWRMRIACWIPKATNTHTHTHTHTHTQYNTYCFSTATTVIRTRLNVTSYVHWSSCISKPVNIYKRHDASSVVFQLPICDNRTGINCLVSIITFRMLTKEIPSWAVEASSWNMWWTFDKLTFNKLLLLMSCLDLFNICLTHGCGIPLTILSHHAMHQQTPAFHRHQTYEPPSAPAIPNLEGNASGFTKQRHVTINPSILRPSQTLKYTQAGL